MTWLKRFLLDIARRLDNFVDHLRFRMVKATGIGARLPVKIATYRGFGSHQRIFLQGRVLVKKSVRNVPGSTLRHFLETYQHIESDEVSYARLRVSIENNTFELVTDQEGFFTLDRELDHPLADYEKPWKRVHIQLLETPWKKMDLHKKTRILIPPPEAEFGVITDIDDTILHTGVTSPLKWKVVYNTFFKSPRRRKAFEEAGAFFQALQKGPATKGYNPVFYVSNSPHNLYVKLKEFLKLNHFPKGPILLRDIGIPYRLHPVGYQGHKASSIARILSTFPQLSFILIGDSGERDLYIYHEIAQSFPGRIQAIYIRDVQHRKRYRKIVDYLDRVQHLHIHIFTSYLQLAEVVGRNHLIDPEYFASLRRHDPV